MLWVPKMQIALVPIQRKIEFNVGPCGMNESELDFAPIKTFQPCSQLISQGMRLCISQFQQCPSPSG